MKNTETKKTKCARRKAKYATGTTMSVSAIVSILKSSPKMEKST